MSDTTRIPLRCPSNHWGYAVDATGAHEVRCKSQHCRTSEGLAVIHTFDNASGSHVTRLDDRAQGPEETDDARHPTV